MLDEYILGQLDKIRQERQKLQEKLMGLTDEETRCRNEISRLLEQEDVGYELFSPRAGDDTVKTKIDEIQKHIEDLQYKQADVTESLAENQERVDHYETLLEEARNREPGKESDDQKNEEPEGKNTLLNELENDEDYRTLYLGELKLVLEKIDTCLNLIGHNRSQCKNELKNLRYHLRSVISEAETNKN